jgi:hypothetical protein
VSTIGHHYDVEICPACHEQVFPDSLGDYFCSAAGCDWHGRPLRLSVFMTDAHVRLKLRQEEMRSGG